MVGRRAIALLLSVLTVVATSAGPAAAHGRGSESTNFSSRVVDAPDLPGVTWEVYGGDQYLAVTNTSDTEIVVTGYSDEPYLRVGPDGVFHNLASEAAYRNAERYGEVTNIPENVGPQVAPRWKKVSGKPTYAWYDHRIHWMKPRSLPVVVDTREEALINSWVVPFGGGGQDYEVTGELRWVPPPSPLPWLAIALLLTLPALLGLLALRRDGRLDGETPELADGPESPRWVRTLVRPAAFVLLAVSLLNVTHLIDDLAAVPLPLPERLISAVQTALFIALGAFGAVVSLRGRDGAFTALGVGSGGIFIGQGLLYMDALRTTTSATVFPDPLARLVVSLSLAQLLAVGAVAVIGHRRLAAAEPSGGHEPSEAPAT